MGYHNPSYCQFLPSVFPHLARVPQVTQCYLPRPWTPPSPRILTRKVWAVSTCTHIFQALKLPVSQSLLVYPALSKSRLRAKLTRPSSSQ